MALGGPTSWSLTVRWDGVTFDDETPRVKAGGDAVVITRGRGSEADDVQPGVLTALFDNTDGARTPDNPLSPDFPFITDGAWTRFVVTRGGVPSTRHRGRISVGEPQMPDGEPSRAVVAIESVDMLGTIAERDLLCDWSEQWVNQAETETVEFYPVDEDVVTPSVLRNIGSGVGTARIVPAVSRLGSAKTETPEGIALDGSIVLTPSATGVGPVIIGDTAIAAGSVLGVAFTFRSTDRTATVSPVDKYVAVGLNAAGAVVWSIRLKDNAGQCDLNLYDAAGTFVYTLVVGFSSAGEAEGDGEWYSVHLQRNGASNNIFVRRASDGVLVCSASGAPDIRATDSVVLGGLATAKKGPGRQTNCVKATFGAFLLTTSINGFTTYLTVDAVTPAQTRFTDLNLYCDFASAQIGTRNRDVIRKSSSGRTGFEVLAELARTAGAVVVASRTSDGTLLWYDADTQNLPTVALTVDVELDADGSGGFPWRKGDVPSYVKATYPGGAVAYQDTSRPRKDASVDTCAVDAAGALDVAARLVNSSRSLRLTKLVVDVATASNDLWSSIMALEIGQRIRCNLGVAGSPLVSQYGRTYVDVYAVGWREVYGRDVAYWEIDTVPADDPVAGVYDAGVARGRLAAAAGAMTITGGTAIGSTAAGGTVIVTTAFGPTFTTTGARYPMTLDWNGEHITVTAPGGATSPQTFPVTARGVNGTVARAHVAGEPVNVALAAAWTY